MPNLLKLLLPDYCLNCRVEVEDYGLCPSCFKQVKFISANSCKICSHPFASMDNFEKICGKCLIELPYFDRNISALELDDVVRSLIVAFKYNDQQVYRKYFVTVMRQKACELINECDIICPVPMHWFKVFMRNFNQSCVLAKAIAAAESKQYIPNLLLKIKYTTAQVKLSASARVKNIAGSIKYNKNIDIKDKKILLIDDVYTTGSTLNECAKELRKAGCAKIYTLTIAKKIWSSAS